ncbi:hypothetical protein DYB37_009546 [Aphanomyces astaci]|uniref:Tr-type G domain-containing protein n=3 Tax=Aphanomyces astaci TaxID=112090 RepID=A0A3R6X969_APHAT|nr:hypothetical protein DYB35_004361 [Aphanomyces astaci]RHZ14662.1 hypothetical protein DYB37_009546 [Aphanomyces astaci]
MASFPTSWQERYASKKPKARALISPFQVRFLDNTEEEQTRGITMKSSAISLMYEGPLTPSERKAGGLDSTNDDVTVPYLINLVDSPGHVDFSFDVSTAVRLCDGALVLIDVIEGVCAQTHAVLRQVAWQEGIRPCLVLNKIDRLIHELQFTPVEAYQHICRIVEQANVIISSMIRSDKLDEEQEIDVSLLDDDDDQTETLERQWMFSPAYGNVLFGSAYDGWAFSIGYFAAYYSKKFDTPQAQWRQGLWGDHYFHAKTKVIRSTPWTSSSVPMFISFILEPLWSVYKTMMEPLPPPTQLATDGTYLEKLRQLTKSLRVAKLVNDRELLQRDRKLALQAVMRKWLPLAPSVLKMVSRVLPSPIAAQKTRADRLCVPDAADADQVATFHSIQVGRVFSGTLKAQDLLYLLGPKYNGSEGVSSSHVTEISPTSLQLYMVMGADFVLVNEVPPGNIVGIVGLHEHVLKTATLASTVACPSLAKMPYQAKPIVRVAVEPEDPRHFAELEAGLQRLYRSDPTVEVHVQETGEHVIVALGELHLERCVKDLTERFAKVPLRVSEPLVGFRETIANGDANYDKLAIFNFKHLHMSDMTTGRTTDGKFKTVVCPTPDCQVTLHLRAMPLPPSVVAFLEKHADTWRALQDDSDDSVDVTSVKDELTAVLQGLPDYASASTIFQVNTGNPDSDPRAKFESSLITGFQLATTSGPLCDEPVWGVAFVIEDMVLTPTEDAAAIYGPLSGQVISTMKSGCRNAFIQQPVRLVEAMYLCTVQCHAEQLGKLYSVFAKRRAKVLSEELTDGSALFRIEAHLPVVESFGFATELLKNTSGNASNPQLIFDHWTTMDEDPFFQPHTDEEREDFGERIDEHNAVRRLIEMVRKRKGLAREEKVVVHAEKQRTLGRNK